MLRNITRICAAFALFSSLLPMAPAVAGQGIDWHKDLPEAYRQAQHEGKPLFIYFYGSGEEGSYPYCRKFESETLASREMAAFGERVVFVAVDLTEVSADSDAARFAEQLEVTKVPAMALIECCEDGWVINGDTEGYWEKEEFVKAIRGDIVRTMIDIRRSQLAPLAEGEIVEQASIRMQRIAERSAAEKECADAMTTLNAKLLERGEFAEEEYLAASAARRVAIDGLIDAILDFAALPTDESRELGTLILYLGLCEYELRTNLEEDLTALCLSGYLMGDALEQAKALVRNTDDAITAVANNLQEATDAANEKFNERLKLVAAN